MRVITSTLKVSFDRKKAELKAKVNVVHARVA